MVSQFLHHLSALLPVLRHHPVSPLPQAPCLRRAHFAIWSLGLVICQQTVSQFQLLLVQGLGRYHAATVGQAVALIIGMHQVGKGGSNL